jgi:hypothetical protein
LRPRWWAIVFLLALSLRLAFVLGAAEPLLYSHPYNYFHGALSVLEHPRPLWFVLHSDRWHQWLGPWTIAPLYYLFLAGVMGTIGAHLLPILLIQCVLDSLVAVMTGALGRALWPRFGAWAGVAYALNAHAIEICGSTLTENLHTPLLVAALWALVEGTRRRDGRLTALGGFVLGLSALARSVSTAFVPLAAIWRWRQDGGRDLRGAAVIVGAAACAILPWTVRNAVLIGDLVPVETNAIYNLWDDNSFAEGARRQRQEETIASQPTLAGQRAQALKFTARGIARNPGAFVRKAWWNLLHFVRLDGLHLLLRVEEPQPAWRAAALILLDDTIVLAVVILFIVFVAAGPPSAARGLLLLFAGYYLLMVVVVFHNEIRYRATLMPVALACAAGGAAALFDPQRRALTRTRIALVIAVLSAAFMLRPYPVRAWRAVASLFATGDAAAARDPEAARPWLRQGRALAQAEAWDAAIDAYQRAQARKSHVWTPTVVMPRLLREAGRTAEADAAERAADRFSFDIDPWLAQEVAWRELPPPRTDEVLLGRGDYGAVRGFSLPQQDHRWTLGRAWIRLRPRLAAAVYDVTLDMGSPEPSPFATPRVQVAVNGGGQAGFTLDREVRSYRLRAQPSPDGVLTVSLRAPTWNRDHQPAEQGIRVDRLRLTPVTID